MSSSKLSPAEKAPSEAFFCGPYLVAPRRLPGTSHVIYAIAYAGIELGRQVSRPNVEQCTAFLSTGTPGAIAISKLPITLRTLLRSSLAELGSRLPRQTRAPASSSSKKKLRAFEPPKRARFACRVCHKTKYVTEFYLSSSGSTRERTCKTCQDTGRKWKS